MLNNGEIIWTYVLVGTIFSVIINMFDVLHKYWMFVVVGVVLGISLCWWLNTLKLKRGINENRSEQ